MTISFMKNIRILSIATILVCSFPLTIPLYAMDSAHAAAMSDIDESSDHAGAPVAITPENTNSDAATCALLPKTPQEIDEANRALWNATQNNDLKKAQAALEAGANPTTLINKKELLLMYALFYRNVSLIKLLLDHHADVNQKDTHGFTPLDHISQFSRARQCGKHAKDAPKHTTTPSLLILIFAGADIAQVEIPHKSILNILPIALAAKQNADRELDILTSIAQQKQIQDLYIPVEYLAQIIIDYAVPYYTNYADDQVAYDFLNERIAQQWTHIKEQLKLTRNNN